MKKVLAFAILICMLSISFSKAQTTLNDYKKVDYIQVHEDNVDSFIKFSKKELKPLYQKLIDSGTIKSWGLYIVKHPGGEKSDYNFVSITTGDELDLLDEQFNKIATTQFIPSSASSKQAKTLRKSCTLFKSELWGVENIVSGNDNSPSQYMNMGFMDVAPGKGLDYLMLEEEIAKPIHEERVEQQKMAGWEVYSLITPGGSQYDYNFSTANYYNQLRDLKFGFTEEIINQTTGKNANISELFDTIYSTRDLVKVELWELVTYTD